jgi:hypothetical protein
MKATPGNRPFIAQRLASQLGTLAASAGVQSSGERRGPDKPGQAAQVYPLARPVPFNPALPIPGALAPPGALMWALP